MGKRSTEQELKSRGTRIYTIPAQNRYGRGEEGGEILLQVLFEVLDRGRPGLPGRSPGRSGAAVRGPPGPAPRPAGRWNPSPPPQRKPTVANLSFAAGRPLPYRLTASSTATTSGADRPRTAFTTSSRLPNLSVPPPPLPLPDERARALG